MIWLRYLPLIRQQNTNPQDWQAATRLGEGEPVGGLGAAMYDALDEARHKGQVFRGIATIMLSFIDQAAALQQRVEDLEREAQKSADLLAAEQARVAELETAHASARTEVLFLQDRISPQSTFEGLRELFQQQKEIEAAIRKTAAVVFAPDTTVYWDHNGHTQCGRVDHVDYWGQVWVENQRTGVLRKLQPYEVRPESVAAGAMYGVETADVA